MILYIAAIQLNISGSSLNLSCHNFFLESLLAPAKVIEVSVSKNTIITPIEKKAALEFQEFICYPGDPEIRDYMINGKYCARLNVHDYNLDVQLTENGMQRNGWPFLCLEHYLLDTNALILHCCFIQHQGKAILFSAPSGTGKSTQGRYWRDLYGAEIINGDRCVLQRTEEGWYASGFPFHGKDPECLNVAIPIQAVIIIRQSTKNQIVIPSLAEIVSLLYSEITVNQWHKERVSKVLDLIQDFVNSVPVRMEYCKYGPSSAEYCYHYLFDEKCLSMPEGTQSQSKIPAL